MQHLVRADFFRLALVARSALAYQFELTHFNYCHEETKGEKKCKTQNVSKNHKNARKLNDDDSANICCHFVFLFRRVQRQFNLQNAFIKL